MKYKTEVKLSSLNKKMAVPDLEETVFDYCNLRFDFKKINELIKIISSDIFFITKEDIKLNIEINYPCVNNTVEITLSEKDSKLLVNNEKTYDILQLPLTISIGSKDSINYDVYKKIKEIYSYEVSDISYSKPIAKLFELIQDSFKVKDFKKIIYENKLYKNITHSIKQNGFSISYDSTSCLIKSSTDEIVFEMFLDSYNGSFDISLEGSKINFNSTKLLKMTPKEFKSIIQNLMSLSDYKFANLKEMSDHLQIYSLIEY